MNRKQLLILLVLVAVLGAAGLYLYRGNASSWKGGTRATGQKPVSYTHLTLPTNREV